MSRVPENKSNKAIKRTSLEDLPDEITSEIVSRLHPKEVSCFKTVSKQWNEWLSDPFFKDMYHERWNKNVPKLLAAGISYTEGRDDKGEFYEYLYVKISSLDLEGEGTVHYKDVTRKLNGGKTRMLHAANGSGLTCFANADEFFIFNPTSKRWANLPKMSSSTYGFSRAGFGYDPSSKEYIFVHIFVEDFVTRCEWLALSEANEQQDISSSVSWKVLETPCPFPVRKTGVLVNGLFYFCVSDDSDYCHHSAQEVMFSVDLKNESFKIIGHPDESVYDQENRTFVVELNGMLCFGDILKRTAELDLWILTDAETMGWTKLCRVDLTKLDGFNGRFVGEVSVLGLRKGELIINNVNKNRLDFYNIEDGTAREGTVSILRWCHFCLYNETLSFLNLRE